MIEYNPGELSRRDVDAVGYHFTNATASHYKIPYPLRENRQIFLQRWGNKLQYDEWKVL